MHWMSWGRRQLLFYIKIVAFKFRIPIDRCAHLTNRIPVVAISCSSYLFFSALIFFTALRAIIFLSLLLDFFFCSSGHRTPNWVSSDIVLWLWIFFFSWINDNSSSNTGLHTRWPLLLLSSTYNKNFYDSFLSISSHCHSVGIYYHYYILDSY